MRIGNLWLSAAWKGVFALFCAVALVVDFEFFGPAPRPHWHYLNYFTILSNIACMIFFALAFVASAGALRRGERDFAWHPRLEGVFVFCITVVGIVYATLLAPKDIAEGHFFNFENIVLHYTGPVMVLLDWLLFSPKGSFRAVDPLRWLLVPLGYFGYILLRSTFAGEIGDSGSAFPYDFIDPAVQGGWGPMLRGVFFIALGMAVVGYLIFVADRLLRRRV